MFSKPTTKCSPTNSLRFFNIATNSSPPKNNRYGIEFELEFNKILSIDSAALMEIANYFSVKKDESLNNTGFEFVFKQPLPLEKTKTAVTTLFTWIEKRYKNPISLSHRCSTHVHCNTSGWSLEDLIKFCTSWYLIENLMYETYSPKRRYNKFCLTASEAGGIVEAFKDRLPSKNISSLSHDIGKYAALNLSSLVKYGSVEFRLLPGCDDPEQLFNFLSVLEELYTILDTTRDLTPSQLFEDFNEETALSFIKKFMPAAWELIHKNVQQQIIDKEVSEAWWRVQDIINAVDWKASRDKAPVKKQHPMGSKTFIVDGHQIITDDFIYFETAPPAPDNF